MRRSNSTLQGIEATGIDFASRFPPRQLEARGFEAKILELGIETMKIESGACDLPPEGTKEKELEDGYRMRDRIIGFSIFGGYP